MTPSGRPVPRHARLVAIVGFLIYAGHLADAGHLAARTAAGEQTSRPRARGTAPTSDVLTHSPLAPCKGGRAPSAGRRRPLRVATWNIQAALSAPPDEIAAELQSMKADVMGLQEVDFRVRRSGFTDQPQTLATALAAHYVFAASIKWDGGDYGLAVVSRWPLVAVQRHRLDQTEYGEPRIVLEVTVCAHGRPLRIFNHHAAIGGHSRHSGLTRLRELVAPHLGGGVVVLGDFNERPTGAGLRLLLDAGLVDAGAEQNANTAGGGRIDYVLLDPPLAKRLRSTQVWPTRKSDHHALISEFDW
jgi:endonuclease/exonuclease/phosphatase family metal-dependent hydrolase